MRDIEIFSACRVEGDIFARSDEWRRSLMTRRRPTLRRRHLRYYGERRQVAIFITGAAWHWLRATKYRPYQPRAESRYMPMFIMKPPCIDGMLWATNAPRGMAMPAHQ